MISRKLDRRLTFAIGIWQLIDGVITILIYGSYIKITGSKGGNVLNYQSAKALNSIFGSMYMFVVIFGIILIGLGILNIYFSKTYLQDGKQNYWLPIYLLILALVAYFCLDIITVGLSVTCGIIALSKNKAIKQTVKSQKQAVI